MAEPGDQLSPNPTNSGASAAELPDAPADQHIRAGEPGQKTGNSSTKAVADSTTPASADDLSAVLRNWDILFLGLAAALVAILASSPILNSDFFRHLSTGRALVQGDYWFGGEPFTYTGAGHYWLNSSWLFDVAAFGLFSVGGGWALTGLKVFFAVGTAVILVQIAGDKKGLWLAALCPAVAVLVFLSLVHDVNQQPLLPLLKVALLFIPVALAGNISNWRSSAQFPLAVGGIILSAAGTFWLFQDTGLLALLILGKIAAIVMLVQLWLLQKPADDQLWWTGLTLLAAAVASMPWLELRPIAASYFMLALTFLFVQRGTRYLTQKGSGHPSASDGSAKKDSRPFQHSLIGSSLYAFWPVLVIFLLWVNIDTWFLLGLILIALYGMGVMITDIRSGQKQADGHIAVGGNTSLLPHIGLLLTTSFLICLVNPHHIHVFRLPAQLNHALAPSDSFESMNRFTQFMVWDAGYYWSETGLQPAGLAFLILSAISAFSFVLIFPRWSAPRLLIWAALFLLALLHTASIPFFAVAAVPVTALNIADYARRRFPAIEKLKGTTRGWVVVARPLGVLATLAMLTIAWPGLLQGSFSGPGYWALVEDEYLNESAKIVSEWSSKRQQREQAWRGLNTSPEFGDYQDWLCPQQKCFVDSRGLYDPTAAQDYHTIRKVLFGPVPLSLPRGEDALTPMRRVLRRWNANYLVLHEKEADRLAEAFFRLGLHKQEWPLLHLQGCTAIFGWRDPAASRQKDAFADLQSDLEREVFLPEKKLKIGREGPFPDHSWWRRYLRSMQPHSAKRTEAELLLLLFRNQEAEYWRKSQQRLQLYQAAGRVVDLVGVDWAGKLLNGYLRENPQGAALDAFHVQQDLGPLPLLYLAVRAARRAIQDDPFDAETHLILGKAYIALSHKTRERGWARRSGRLARLRTIQTICALKQAVSLDPDLGEAHRILANLYQDRNLNYVDLALDHQEEFVRCEQQKGPHPSESAGAFKLRMDEIRHETRQLKEFVNRIQEQYDKETADFVFPLRLQLAWKRGLGKKALKLLLESEISVFGKDGTLLQLQLLLATGRLRHVQQLLPTPKLQELIGENKYNWLQAQLAAGLGDYASADRHLDWIAFGKGKSVEFDKFQRNFAEDASAMARMLVLNHAFTPLTPPAQLEHNWWATRITAQRLWGGVAIFSPIADWTTLRGLLALEAGDGQKTEELCRGALTIWQNKQGKSSSTAIDFGLRPAAQQILEMFEASRSRQKSTPGKK